MLSLEEYGLNDEQMAAIIREADVFLVACPGSGKTFTLTFKIARELDRLQSDKQYIAAITYTNRAAEEIHERIERLGVDTSQLWIGTIHAFCLEWILKPYFVYHPKIRNGFRVIDMHEREELLTRLCVPYRSARVTHWDCEYRFAASGQLTLTCRDPLKIEAVNEVLAEYFEILTASRQVDFELLLQYAHDLITQTPTIAKLLAKLFSHVLVDEFQDTKEIQYEILAALLRAREQCPRVFIVGDPNQAIFASLGGRAISAAEFNALARISMQELHLSRNYRSSDRIIKYFDHFRIVPSPVEAASKLSSYPSKITYDTHTLRDDLEAEIARLIRFNVETEKILPAELCVLAPQWVHLASMTRALSVRLPDYQFDGPGMVPFARDIENFWYKVAKIALTKPSPGLYITRLRWAGEVLSALRDARVSVDTLTAKEILRASNELHIDEPNGLAYLNRYFDELFASLAIDFRSAEALQEHHSAFFAGSEARIAHLSREGTAGIADTATFKRVFAPRTGITVSTIHGVKGAEFDAVIAYALLDGLVPYFADRDQETSAKKLLYVISSRARKNLHLISESGRLNRFRREYSPTPVLASYTFNYD